MPTERIQIVVSERGVRRVSRNLKSIGTSASAAGGAVKLLRRSLGLLGGALILTSIVKTLADFGQAMATVKAITNATTTQFTAMRDVAKDLGATTRFSATQAAEGMQFLARAGFEANEVMQAIGPTLTLAQAGALDLARAADIASNVLKGFRLEAAATQRVVDVLALTANSANTNVEQLGSAMSFVAPAAAALGVSIEETAASIGVLSDAGIQATRAGTGLRQIFIKLLSPTGRAAAALERVGVAAADIDIQSRGLIPALQKLADANIGLADAADIVGRRQASAFLVLLQGVGQVGKLTDALDLADGTAKRVARTMDDTLRGALFAVKSATEATVIAFGELGADSTLTTALRGLATLLRSVAKNMDDVGTAVKVLGAVFVTIFRGVILGAIDAVIAGLVTLSAAALANPFTAILVAVGAATAAMILFKDETITVGTTTLRVGSILAGIWATIRDIVSGLVLQLAALARGLFNLSTLDFSGANAAFTSFMVEGAKVFDALMGEAFVKALKQADELARKLRVTENRRALLGADGPDPVDLLRPDTRKTRGGTGAAAKPEDIKDAFRALRDALDPIGAAQREVAESQELLNKAFAQGVVDTKALEQLQRRLTVATRDALDPVAKLNTDLETQSRLAGLTAKQQGVEIQLIQIRNDLLRRGISLTASDLLSIKKRLSSNQRLNEVTRKQVDLLKQLRGDQVQFKLEREAINQLFRDGAVTLAEYVRLLEQLQLKMLATDRTIQGGLKRGLAQLKLEFEDLSKIAETTLVNSFKKAEDALVQFVTTGKLNFKDLVNSILEDLARLAIRQAITKPLFDILGGLLGGLGGGGGIPGTGAPVFTPSAGSVVSVATGGLLRGGGSGTSDSIPARLSNGEFVVNAASTSDFLPLLSAINNFKGGGTAPRGGGGVTIIDQRSSDSPPLEAQEGTGAGGLREVQVIIRDTVDRQISGGQHDRAFFGRFGLTPTLRTR